MPLPPAVAGARVERGTQRVRRASLGAVGGGAGPRRRPVCEPARRLAPAGDRDRRPSWALTVPGRTPRRSWRRAPRGSSRRAGRSRPTSPKETERRARPRRAAEPSRGTGLAEPPVGRAEGRRPAASRSPPRPSPRQRSPRRRRRSAEARRGAGAAARADVVLDRPRRSAWRSSPCVYAFMTWRARRDLQDAALVVLPARGADPRGAGLDRLRARHAHGGGGGRRLRRLPAGLGVSLHRRAARAGRAACSSPR